MNGHRRRRRFISIQLLLQNGKGNALISVFYDESGSSSLIQLLTKAAMLTTDNDKPYTDSVVVHVCSCTSKQPFVRCIRGFLSLLLRNTAVQRIQCSTTASLSCDSVLLRLLLFLTCRSIIIACYLTGFKHTNYLKLNNIAAVAIYSCCSCWKVARGCTHTHTH